MSNLTATQQEQVKHQITVLTAILNGQAVEFKPRYADCGFQLYVPTPGIIDLNVSSYEWRIKPVTRFNDLKPGEFFRVKGQQSDVLMKTARSLNDDGEVEQMVWVKCSNPKYIGTHDNYGSNPEVVIVPSPF